jgi:hypothetical protein
LLREMPVSLCHFFWFRFHALCPSLSASFTDQSVLRRHAPQSKRFICSVERLNFLGRGFH